MASIEHRGNSYRVRYFDALGNRDSASFSNPEDAQCFIDVMTADRHRGLWVDQSAGKITLAEWFDQWLPLQVHLRATTLEREQNYFRSLVAPALGGRSLIDIHQVMVQTWIKELSQKYAPATVVKAYQLLSKLMRSAKADGRLARVPLDEIKLPTIQEKEMMIIDESEGDALHDAIIDRYKLFVTIGIYAGLRHGELGALRPSKLNFLRNRIEINEATVELSGKGVTLSTVKTRAGRRVVPVPRFVMDEAEAHIEKFQVGRDDFLFAGEKGGIWRKSNFRERVWKPLLVDLSLEGFRIHDMRHTCVSLWIANNANFKEIATWAGHRSISTVIDRYGHLYEDGGKVLTEKMDEKHRARQRAAKRGRSASESQTG